MNSVILYTRTGEGWRYDLGIVVTIYMVISSLVSLAILIVRRHHEPFKSNGWYGCRHVVTCTGAYLIEHAPRLGKHSLLIELQSVNTCYQHGSRRSLSRSSCAVQVVAQHIRVRWPVHAGGAAP